VVQPTVASRLQRRIAFISSDLALGATLRAALPAGWEIVQVQDLAALGDFAAVLQYRFLLLDLDDTAVDALDLIDTVRRELMLNIAILCIGGEVAMRDAARLARADRFFERSAVVEVVQQFCAQYDW
jgi:DNA-binding response OmpR family regulator